MVPRVDSAISGPSARALETDLVAASRAQSKYIASWKSNQLCKSCHCNCPMRQLLEGLQLIAITATTLRYTVRGEKNSKSVAGVKVEELKSCVVDVCDVAASRKIARMKVTSSLSVSDQTFKISSAGHPCFVCIYKHM